jgi:hypothetical protein
MNASHGTLQAVGVNVMIMRRITRHKSLCVHCNNQCFQSSKTIASDQACCEGASEHVVVRIVVTQQQILKEVVKQQGTCKTAGNSQWFKVLQTRQATANVQTISFS